MNVFMILDRFSGLEDIDKKYTIKILEIFEFCVVFDYHESYDFYRVIFCLFQILFLWWQNLLYMLYINLISYIIHLFI